MTVRLREKNCRTKKSGKCKRNQGPSVDRHLRLVVDGEEVDVVACLLNIQSEARQGQEVEDDDDDNTR